MREIRALPWITALLLALTAPAGWTQDSDTDSEQQDMFFVENCLQRAVEEQVPEDRIDSFIDSCINGSYQQLQQDSGDSGKNEDTDPDATDDAVDQGNLVPPAVDDNNAGNFTTP